MSLRGLALHALGGVRAVTTLAAFGVAAALLVGACKAATHYAKTQEMVRAR